MNHITVKARYVSVAVACLIAALLAPAGAQAGSYTVVSCDSAVSFGFNASAWTPYGNAGRAYQQCPTSGAFTAGISNRLTDGVFSGFNHSGHAFTAPPGATLTKIRWAGRMVRNNCEWGTFILAVPSTASVLGYRNGQLCDAKSFDNRSWPISVVVPAGTSRLEQLVICGASVCQAGATLHTQSVEVTVDDPVPPSISLSGPLASEQWVSGTTGEPPKVLVTASDNAGVQRIEASLGAERRAEAYPCDWAHAQPCPGQPTASTGISIANLHDGRHTLSVSALDAGGNPATLARDVYVDNTPPDPVLPEIGGGTAWRRTNGFAASWTNPPNVAAPITRAHWKLCASDGTCPSGGQRAGDNIHALPPISAPSPGEFRLYVWLEDAAGNKREAHAPLSAPVRFDPEAPEIAFSPVDPADPLRVAVNVTDRHSGIARGEIEMRAAGSHTWHGLGTELEGSELVAYVDDERFRTGAYEFRARAVDHAGNEASTGKRIDGSAATLRLPARIDTRLRVGIPTRVRGRRGRTRVRLDSTIVASFGRTVRLTGRLTNADGQPIEAATVEALQTNSEGLTLPIGLATTGLDGRFRYVLRANRNRNIVFRYPGSRRIGAATSRFRMQVPAATSIQVNRPLVRNGQAVRFSGRVGSRPLPANGKLIEMQAHFRGRWRTFSTVRSDSAGFWHFPYRFGATLGRVVYRFRALLPSEGGYPFVDGRSRTARVVVLGP